MADSLVSNLTAASTLDGTELLYGAQGGNDRKITVNQLHAGVPIVRKFSFAYNTANILTGATVYTPTVGDILMDAWIQIDTAWNGVGDSPDGAPLVDVGMFSTQESGWFGYGVGPVYAGVADNAIYAFPDPGTLLTQVGSGAPPSLLSLSLDFQMHSIPVPTMRRELPAKFLTADPIKVCVSQDGTNTGADPGASQGAGVLYLVVVTPV